MDALTIANLSKYYANHTALDDVSLSVPEAAIYGLLGPNGAGKTTLIRIINQIINSDKGTITLFGESLAPKHIMQIGYLPEERGLYKKIKIGDQLIYLARLRGLTHADASERVKAWFKKFDISQWWNKKVEDLSKGMAQKVQFISTVLHEPRLLILDEPFSGFDPVNAQLITREILELRDKGSTIIFSTHRMETVEALCDHIALINKSKKILEGPTRKIRHTYKSNSFVVEHPGTIAFSDADFTLTGSEDIGEGFYRSCFAASNGATSNQLLQKLLPLTEIRSFAEQVPTIHDIFIKLVKGGSNE